MILCRMSLVFKILDSYFYFDDTKISAIRYFSPFISLRFTNQKVTN